MHPLDSVFYAARKEQLAQSIQTQNLSTKDLIEYGLGKHKGSWRAVWALRDLLKQFDRQLIEAALPKFVAQLPQLHEGHQREILRLIKMFSFSEELEGKLFEQCLHIWQQVHYSSGLRMVAFNILLNIGTRYPELRKEISFYTSSVFIDSLSPAIKKSIQKSINKTFN